MDKKAKSANNVVTNYSIVGLKLKCIVHLTRIVWVGRFASS